LFDPNQEFQEIGVKLNNKTFWKHYGSSLEAVSDDDGNSLALFHDALGNLKAMVSQDNNHWIEELPSPYGPTGPPTTIDSTLLSFAKSHTWQGNRQDPTGLIHLGARYYHPQTGRFLSPDPIGYPVPLDLYAYATGDPINFRDPSGRFRSPSYEPVGATSIALGGIQMHSGFTEAAIGASIIAGGIATGGVGPAIVGGAYGFYLMFNGLDNVFAGAQQIGTGEYRDSLVSQSLQYMGLSSDNANTVEWVASLGTSNSALISKARRNLASTTSKQLKGFKPFTERNYRENLKRLTGMNPPRNIEAHHVFPQTMRDEFLKKGINIDDPKYLTWWEKRPHGSNASEYNGIWREFLADSPRATKEQILEYGREIMTNLGHQVNF